MAIRAWPAGPRGLGPHRPAAARASLRPARAGPQARIKFKKKKKSKKSRADTWHIISTITGQLTERN